MRYPWPLGPVAPVVGDLPDLGRLEAVIGRPIVFKCGSLGEVALDLVQRYHLAQFFVEEFIPDTLNFAAELEVSEVPAIHRVGGQAQLRCLPLKVEEGDKFGTILDCVGDHRLAVNSEESAPEINIKNK